MPVPFWGWCDCLQNLNRSASSTLRELPPPRNGLPVPTSGVAVMGRKPMPRPEASTPFWAKSTPKLGQSGLAKLGVIENVINVDPELHAKPLSDLGVLGQTEIKFL